MVQGGYSEDEDGVLRIGGVVLRVDEEGHVLSRHRKGRRQKVQRSGSMAVPLQPCYVLQLQAAAGLHSIYSSSRQLTSSTAGPHRLAVLGPPRCAGGPTLASRPVLVVLC